MYDIDNIVKSESKILKFIIVIFALCSIFKLGKSMGEFIYYLGH